MYDEKTPGPEKPGGIQSWREKVEKTSQLSEIKGSSRDF